MDTVKLVERCADEFIEIRRYLHNHPELSNREYETTKLIREKLEEYGVEICEIGLKTGVLGLIRGGRPGKTAALREDIDALPMPELTGLPFASETENVCHSCGHDIHTATLLCCAKVLSEIRDELSGNVMLIFQPAEEKGSGAQQFVDCKFYEAAKPDVFAGLHVSPELSAGTVGFKKGAANASCDMFRVRVTGKGGHGAHPENFIDPVMISAYMITQLQTVVSRENYPIGAAVLTIGSIHGGNAGNVVPDFVDFAGTLRSLSPEYRQKMKEAIARIVKSCAEGMRGQAEITWEAGLPPLVNDEGVIDGLCAAAEKTIGADHIVMSGDLSLGSEDFSVFFPEYAPGAQFRLGSGNADPDSRLGLHNSKNVFDDSCIRTGAEVLIQYVRDFLSE